MGRFVPAAGLDARVAVSIGRPGVERLASEVRDLAKARAPGAATWVTSHDERVRRTHQEADTQTIPDNIRFILHKVGPRGLPDEATELGREPRDPDLSAANRYGCRCVSVPVEGIVAESLHATPAVVQGTRVVAQVETRFNRAAESEFASAPDAGGRWFGGAIDEVAATSRQARARRT